jgi:hypothetical protein
MKKISLIYCTMVPWMECQRCFIGPSVLDLGDVIEFTIGLFFIEIGFSVRRKREPYS